MNALMTRITMLIAIAAGAATAMGDQREAFFESRIRPVLVEHCYSCHSADAKQLRGGLLLDSSESTLAGGDSGPAIIPGQPEESLLVSALRHESFEMPPDRRLPEEIINDFRKWIRDGAFDPRQGGKVVKRTSIDLEQGRQFWSFQPVRRPNIPAVSSDWPVNEIDRFVAARHHGAAVQPAQDAEPWQIVRRLHFILTGLPPTIDELRQFELAWSRDRSLAVADEVQRLLQSPRFGERFGRHWLDVTRFAESSGGGRSLMYPHAWRFRDYVIRSFNDDKPVDQLIREHVAGDLLPWQTREQHDDQLTGVGYLVLGPHNYEQQDKELLQLDVIDEQIDTLGRTFLGMTLGCARCHDHKFDPVPTTDYYALAGIFRSTQTLTPGNVSGYVTTSLKFGRDASAEELWTTENERLTKELARLQSQLNPGKRPPNLQADKLPGVVVDDSRARLTGEWVSSTSVQGFVNAGYRHNAAIGVGRTATFQTKLPQSGRYHVLFAYTASGNRANQVPITIRHQAGESTVVLNQQQEPDFDEYFADLGEFTFDQQQPATVLLQTEKATGGVVIIDAVQFLPSETYAEILASRTSNDSLKADINQTVLKQQIRGLEQQISHHQKSKPEVAEVMCVRDVAEPSDGHLHVRGAPRNLGPLIPRGTLSVIGSLQSTQDAASSTDGAFRAIPSSESGRRELAEWLSSPHNPLTSRVFVNRIWQHLIGEGIVRTPDNFGATGQQPTHPELLDFLAWTFVHEDNWSVKKLVTRIATSRTFRMSVDSETLRDDPDNDLLTRAFHRPVDVEVFRDSVLAISGQLDLSTTGGLTIRKLTQYDNGYDHEQLTGPVRSVFVPAFRNSILPVFDVFNMANSNMVTGRRNISTLPTQGLFLMNSPFVLTQSRLAATRLLNSLSLDSGSTDELLSQISLTVLGRTPTSAEQRVMGEYLSHQGINEESLSAVFQSLFASIDFRYLE